MIDVGLLYYEDLSQPVPRKVVEQITEYIRKEVPELHTISLIYVNTL